MIKHFSTARTYSTASMSIQLDCQAYKYNNGEHRKKRYCGFWKESTERDWDGVRTVPILGRIAGAGLRPAGRG